MEIVKKIIVVTCFTVGMFFFSSCEKPTKTDAKVTELILSEELDQKEQLSEVDDWLEQLHQQGNFNGGVLIIKNDSVLFKKTYGYTDFTRQKKLTSNSAFRLASVSKQFTATGIMLLKEQGKLDFDDAVTKYLPELKYDKATVRSLMTHTSGIPDAYMGFPDQYKDEIGSELEISEVVTLLAKADLPFASEPNSTFKYSNTGYVLLAAIIERVSGVSFEEFM